MNTLKVSAVIGLATILAACSGRSGETHAIGSMAYHAAPGGCRVLQDGKALGVHPDHYKTKEGKGLVFEASKPGTARIICGDQETKVTVRPAVKISLERSDGETGVVSTGDLYAPTFCLRAYDKDGKRLELGGLTEEVEFTTSDHLRRIADHGMGGESPSTCLAQQTPQASGRATIGASWRGMTASAELEIRDSTTP